MVIRKPAPTQGKNIKVTETARPDINYPVFCFRYLVRGYDMADCNEAELAALLQQMGRLSLLTWQDVQLAPRHGLGSEKIARTSINAPIPGAVTEDVKAFLAFRFQGLKPFVGFRNGYVFHVLWIDNKFRVYAH